MKAYLYSFTIVHNPAQENELEQSKYHLVYANDYDDALKKIYDLHPTILVGSITLETTF